VATYLVKLACELPDDQRRSLSLWTCAELARALIEAKVVDTISPQSVQRLLESHRLKPWRVHFWLSPKAPCDEVFRQQVLAIMDLYTRALEPHERVLSLDEKTSLQPRTRSAATRPPKPGLLPARLEHEYRRKGALQLFAAFDVRSGEVTGILRRRKRQRLGEVRSAIRFHDETRFLAEEVHDEWSDGMLSAELRLHDLPAAQQAPKLLFSRCGSES
jgi:hypothetical protein